MKAHIYATSEMYREFDEHYLASEYPCLVKFNLRYEDVTVETDPLLRTIMNEPETEIVKRAYIDILYLEELSRLIEAIEYPIIVNFIDKEIHIEIYDTWRE